VGVKSGRVAVGVKTRTVLEGLGEEKGGVFVGLIADIGDGVLEQETVTVANPSINTYCRLRKRMSLLLFYGMNCAVTKLKLTVRMAIRNSTEKSTFLF
jgi:hypothetical protein